jgi:UDP-glucose 4-epimerase
LDADINIVGSLNILGVRKYQVKRIVIYQPAELSMESRCLLPCDEAHPINPICQYGASKHTVEHYLYMYKINYGLPYTSIKISNVYGPRQDPHGEAGVFAIFTGQMLQERQIVINGDGEQTRDFVYVVIAPGRIY